MSHICTLIFFLSLRIVASYQNVGEVCFNKARGKTGSKAMERLVSYCVLFSLQAHIPYRRRVVMTLCFARAFLRTKKLVKWVT